MHMTDIADTLVKANLQQQGFALLPDVFDLAFMQETGAALNELYPWYQTVHQKTGYTGGSEGGSHHILIHKGCFLELLRRLPLTELISEYLDGHFVVNSYGAYNNARDSRIYVKNVHRDIRFFDPGPAQMLNMLVMLDDFTAENGATWLLPGSHKRPARPDDARFFEHGTQTEGKAGTVLLFDSRLWHAGGENRTDQFRRAVTITFTRPHFKQQFDYPAALGYDFCETLPENLKQLVGFNARVPASLEQWYQPAAKRFYKSEQDASHAKLQSGI